MAIVKNKKLFKGLSDQVKEEIVQKLVDNQVNFVQECVEQEMSFEEIQELSRNIMTDCIVKFLESNYTKEVEPEDQVEDQVVEIAKEELSDNSTKEGQHTIYECLEPEFVGTIPVRQDVENLTIEKQKKQPAKKGRPAKRK